MVGGLGHGGESSIGGVSRVASRDSCTCSSSPTATCPSRGARRGMAGLGRRRRLVVAADGGARRAVALGLRPDLVVGDRDSLDPAGIERLRPTGSRSASSPTRQGRVRHRARGARRPSTRARRGSRSSARSAARGSTTRWRTSGCSRYPRSRDGRSCCSMRATRVRAAHAPGPTAAPVERALPGDRATSSRCCRSAATSTGVTTAGLRYPLRDETLAPARPVASRTSVEAAAPRSTAPARPAARRRVRLLRSSPMSMPAGRRPGPRGRAPRRDRHDPPAGRPRGRWTVVYFYPEDDTPGCTTEACQFRDLHGDDRRPRAPRSGASARDGAGSHAAFRAKFGLPFTLLSDEDHAVAEALRRVGREEELRQDVHGDRPVDLPRRARRADRAGPGRRSRPTATRPRSWPPSSEARAAATGVTRGHRR